MVSNRRARKQTHRIGFAECGRFHTENDFQVFFLVKINISSSLWLKSVFLLVYNSSFSIIVELTGTRSFKVGAAAAVGFEWRETPTTENLRSLPWKWWARHRKLYFPILHFPPDPSYIYRAHIIRSPVKGLPGMTLVLHIVSLKSLRDGEGSENGSTSEAHG